MEIRAVRRTTVEIEEERQLHYVAMTRAKRDLHLVVPQRSVMHQQSAQGDRHVYASRTRFMLNSILNLFGVGTWPVASAQAAARVPGQGVRVDLSARDVVVRYNRYTAYTGSRRTTPIHEFADGRRKEFAISRLQLQRRRLSCQELIFCQPTSASAARATTNRRIWSGRGTRRHEEIYFHCSGDKHLISTRMQSQS